MKSRRDFKRILTGVMSATMIFTSIPAAPVMAASTDILAVETNDNLLMGTSEVISESAEETPSPETQVKEETAAENLAVETEAAADVAETAVAEITAERNGETDPVDEGPSVTQKIAALPLVDKGPENTSGYNFRTVLYDTNSYGLETGAAAEGVVPVTVKATNLVKHYNNSHQLYYWIGFGIPRYDDWGITGYYVSGTKPEESTDYTEYTQADTPDWTDENDNNKPYDSLYINADTRAGTSNKLYIGIEYTKEDTKRKIVYALDFSGVTLKNDLPDERSILYDINVATLEDRATMNKISPVIKNFKAEASASADGIWTRAKTPSSVKSDAEVDVKLTGTDLRKHANAEQNNAYWLGIRIAKPADGAGYKVKFAKNNVGELWTSDPRNEESLTYSDMSTAEDENAYTFYFGKLGSKTQFGKYYIQAQYETTVDKDTRTVTYVIDPSGITFDKDLPAVTDVAGIVKAEPVDHAASPEEQLYEAGTYKAEASVSEKNENTVNVKLSAAGLKKHTNGALTPSVGYWVGFGIPNVETAYNKVSFKQSYTKIADATTINDWSEGLDSTLEDGNVTYNTVYFNAGSNQLVENKGYVYIKYEQTRKYSNDNPGCESVIFTYEVDFSNVTFAGLPEITKVEDVAKAPLHDTETGDAAIADNDLITGYAVSGAADETDAKQVNVTIMGTNLKAHKNGQGKNGYWVGFGIPKVEGVTAKYAFKKSDGTWGDFTQLNESDYDELEDGKEYLTVYYDAKNTADKTGWFKMQYTNDMASIEYTFKVDMSAVTTNNGLSKLTADSFVKADPVDAQDAAKKVFDEFSIGTPVVEDDVITVHVNAVNLVPHIAGDSSHTKGYWAGMGIAENTDKNVEVKYFQSYTAVEDVSAISWQDELDNVLKDGDTITHRTVYFNAAKDDLADKTGYVYVKYISKRDESDSKIYTIKVDLSGVQFAKAATPVADPKGGIIMAPVSVKLTSETEGADIYYTTDGSAPTSESSKYESAITISENMTLKAIAVKEDYDESDVMNETYTFINKDEEHDWSLVKFVWPDSMEAGATVTAIFKCSIGKETVEVKAEPVFVRTNGRGDSTYEVTVEGPNGRIYTDVAYYDKDGNKTALEGIGIEGLEESYYYTGKKITPAFTVVDYATDTILGEGTDYTVKYGKNKDIGDASGTITVKGKGNYAVKGATVEATFKIVDPMAGVDTKDFAGSIKKVKVDKADMFYNGKAQYPKTVNITTEADGEITATYNEKTGEYDLSSGAKKVKIVVTNNINKSDRKKGKGTIAVFGADKKAKSGTFTIKAADISKATVSMDNAVFAVKGATPKVTGISCNGVQLVEGKDYKVAYKTNKKTNKVKVTITGKNNFNKKLDKEYDIKPFELKKIDAVGVFDKVAPKKIKLTILDGAGNVIPAKNNYTVKITKSGTTEDISKSKTKLNSVDKIDVEVKGNDKTTKGTVTLKDVKVLTNLGKGTKATLITKEYTGKPIELTEEDFSNITVTNKSAGVLTYGKDFDVVGYRNNVRKGMMYVVIKGIGDKVSGTYNIKVKITARKIVKASDKK